MKVLYQNYLKTAACLALTMAACRIGGGQKDLKTETKLTYSETFEVKEKKPLKADEYGLWNFKDGAVHCSLPKGTKNATIEVIVKSDEMSKGGKKVGEEKASFDITGDTLGRAYGTTNLGLTKLKFVVDGTKSEEDQQKEATKKLFEAIKKGGVTAKPLKK